MPKALKLDLEFAAKLATEKLRLKNLFPFKGVKENADYKFDLRTLIQSAALIEKSGILDLCNIEIGDDLQRDNFEGSTKLMGIIFLILDDINLSEDNIIKWQHIGNKLRLA